MLLAAVSCLPLTTSVEQTQPIFLLAATDRVISSLSPGNATEVSKHDDLGALLRDICDAARRAVVVVGNASEASVVRARRPCDAVDALVEGGGGAPGAEARSGRCGGPACRSLRLFKVRAIAAGLEQAPGGAIYVDNDVALRAGAADALFALVGAVADAGRALGRAPAPWCVPPGHALDDVPAAFCERNAGLIAFADVGRSLGVVAAWRDELARNASFDRGGKRVIRGRFNTSVPRAIVPEKSREMTARPKMSRHEWNMTERGASKVGNFPPKVFPPRSFDHDQMPMRRALYRRRGDLHDLPASVQCRRTCGKRTPCPAEDRPLLWHYHRAARLRFARRTPGCDAAACCGFRP